MAQTKAPHPLYLAAPATIGMLLFNLFAGVCCYIAWRQSWLSLSMAMLANLAGYLEGRTQGMK